jgi:alpha-tubulin suppressor-like RCC1 family protein
VATPVAGATLVSPNPQPVSIQLNQTTAATFQMLVPGEGTVVFARGGLSVDFSVEQGFPDGAACANDVECQSKVCNLEPTSGAMVCQTATCSDGVMNGSEGLVPVHLVGGVDHACAVFSEGRIKCWGSSAFGQTGAEITTPLGDQPGEMGDDSTSWRWDIEARSAQACFRPQAVPA